MERSGRAAGSWRRWTAAGLATAALLLAACGGDDSGDATTAPPDTTTAPGPTTPGSTSAPAGTAAATTAPAAETTSPGAFPIELDQPLGAVTIDAVPERVVTLGSAEADIAVALGVTPVGIASTPIDPSGLSPWLADALGTTEPPELIDITGGAPIEQIAALAPDLIIATSLPSVDADYANLSRIAPVIAYQTALFTDPWQDQTTRIGAVLGRPDEAATLVAGVEGDIDAVVAAHPEFAGATVSAGIVTDPSSINVVQSEQDCTGKLLAELGLRIPDAVQALPPAAIPGITTVGLEQLTAIDADVLLITYYAPGAKDAFESSPIFQSLGAVAGGGYHETTVATGTALRVPSPLSVPYALDQLVPNLVASLG